MPAVGNLARNSGIVEGPTITTLLRLLLPKHILNIGSYSYRKSTPHIYSRKYLKYLFATDGDNYRKPNSITMLSCEAKSEFIGL